MKHPHGKQIAAVVFVFLLFIGLFSIAPNPIFSQEKNPVTTEVTHESIEYFVPGKRIQLVAEVTDDKGIELVRCYFKAEEEAEFVFVKTENYEKNQYRAILPSPSEHTDTLEYLFLVVNTNQQVVKTQTFKTNRNDEKEIPDWQETGSAGAIAVYTELSEAPETIPGFSDSVTLDIIESSARFAMVSGIYSASAMASSGGSAAAATSAGTVTAGAGMSTTAVIATGAAIAAGAGTAAAVSGGGGGGGDEKLNSSACISFTSRNSDSFRWTCGNVDGELSIAATNGVIQTSKYCNYPVGDCDLVVNCTSALADGGSYNINLSGGAIFTDDNSSHKEGTLRTGESKTYPIHISDVADTTIRW